MRWWRDRRLRQMRKMHRQWLGQEQAGSSPLCGDLGSCCILPILMWAKWHGCPRSPCCKVFYCLAGPMCPGCLCLCLRRRSLAAKLCDHEVCSDFTAQRTLQHRHRLLRWICSDHKHPISGRGGCCGGGGGGGRSRRSRGRSSGSSRGAEVQRSKLGRAASRRGQAGR
jgi:hypothetical protein